MAGIKKDLGGKVMGLIIGSARMGKMERLPEGQQETRQAGKCPRRLIICTPKAGIA